MAHAPGGQILPDLHCHIALNNLTVVQIHLYFQVGCTHLLNDFMRVVLPVQKKAGNVPRVDRFDQHITPLLCRFSGRPAQVGDVGGAHLLAGHALGNQAGHQMKARAVQCLDIVQRQTDAGPELGLPPRQASNTTAAAFPRSSDGGTVNTARGGVEQGLLQVVCAEPGRQHFFVPLVGKQKFHRLETIQGSGFKTVEEGHLGVHHGQVGSKFRHGGLKSSAGH